MFSASQALLSLLLPMLMVTAIAALYAGNPPGCGVVLIAGTGSIALGRDARGTIARSSGWGHIIGDEGSGYDIGRRSLQAAARASDGRGPTTSLLMLILSHWQLQNAGELIGKVYGNNDKAVVAALSALAFEGGVPGLATTEAGDWAERARRWAEPETRGSKSCH